MIKDKNKGAKIIEQRPMPNDPDTEKAVLATLMHYNEKFADYSDLLSDELFYTDLNKSIYRTIEGTIREGSITDINSLMSYTKSHDVGFSVQRGDFQGIVQYRSPSTLKQDIARLMDLAKRRVLWKQLMVSADNALNMGKDLSETTDGISEAVEAIKDDTAEEGISSFRDAISELNEIVDGNIRGNRQCICTGYYLFDRFWLLRPNTLTVIAAFTSVGKTALAMNVAYAAALQGIGVAYYSLEMGKAELAARIISNASNLSSAYIMNKHLDQGELEAYRNSAGKMLDLPIFIDENATSSFDRTIRSIRSLKKTKGIGLAVIDYLQIYSQNGESEEGALAAMARSAKNVAKELGIPVILLSQLNRSSEHPSLKMLRGSGQIEESADNIVLIDRPGAYPNNPVRKYDDREIDWCIGKDGLTMENTALLILAKGRGVGIGKELVGFDGVHTHFYELNESFINSSAIRQENAATSHAPTSLEDESPDNNIPF